MKRNKLMIFNMTESPNHEEGIKSCKNDLVLNRYGIQRDGYTRPICVTFDDQRWRKNILAIIEKTYRFSLLHTLCQIRFNTQAVNCCKKLTKSIKTKKRTGIRETLVRSQLSHFCERGLVTAL